MVPFPTLYLADTCSLRRASMRSIWEREFFTQPDLKLTILCTVRAELERQKMLPEHQSEAQAALDFLKKHAEQVIYLPEGAGFVKGTVADREILYHCAVRHAENIVLYTADKKLAEDVLLVNPLVEVRCIQQKSVKTLPPRWRKVYAQLAQKYCFYLTAACVNSPAFAAMMKQPGVAPLFRSRMFLSTASLPLLSDSGKAELEKLEFLGLAPTLLVAGSISASEKTDLLARLLTHSGKTPALVLLGENDTLSSYTELSCIPLAAPEHKGYSVAVLTGNGRISLLPPDKASACVDSQAPVVHMQPPAVQPDPKAEDTASSPADDAPSEAQTNESVPASVPLPKAQKKAPVSLPAPNAKEQVRQWVLAGKITKVGAMIQDDDSLKLHAVYTCFREDVSKLLPILNSLCQRQRLLPAKCFAAYVSTFLPTTAAELNAHFKDKSYVGAIKRLIRSSESLRKCSPAMGTLLKRQKIADEPTLAVLQQLIRSAVANGAPNPSR